VIPGYKSSHPLCCHYYIAAPSSPDPKADQTGGAASVFFESLSFHHQRFYTRGPFSVFLSISPSPRDANVVFPTSFCFSHLFRGSSYFDADRDRVFAPLVGPQSFQSFIVTALRKALQPNPPQRFLVLCSPFLLAPVCGKQGSFASHPINGSIFFCSVVLLPSNQSTAAAYWLSAFSPFFLNTRVLQTPETSEQRLAQFCPFSLSPWICAAWANVSPRLVDRGHQVF